MSFNFMKKRMNPWLIQFIIKNQTCFSYGKSQFFLNLEEEPRYRLRISLQVFWWPSYWSGVCPVSLNLDLLCDWMTSTVGWKWCFVTSEGRSQGEMELSPGSFAIVTFCSLNRDIRILKLPYCEETPDTWTWRNTDKPPSLCPAYFLIHRVHEHNKIVILRLLVLG